ncbi:HAMP domain-containing protein [Pseudomonas sp. UL073]|uniref:histidine kinase n=1 Tax=Zestomonas insulae TaxID=2809017 RepID=A0ABS2IC49_9GAMM|nr:ATP-binding protein [Pseudomonas insulae]MBM7060686.1 HAMP domain-containing protein [Pseudomonas insulae]
MNSIFLRIYGGMLAVLVLVALLGVLTVHLVNEVRSDQYRDRLARGTFSLMAHNLEHMSDVERRRSAVIWGRLLGVPLKLQPIANQPLDSRERGQLFSNKVLVQLTGPHSVKVYSLVSAGEGVVLVGEIRQISEQLARATLYLLVDELVHFPVAEQPARLAQIKEDQKFGFDLHLVRMENIKLDDDQRRRIDEGDTVMALGQGGDSINVYSGVTATPWVLEIGPLYQMNAYPPELIGPICVLGLSLIGLIVYLLVRRLERRLLVLEGAATRIASGRLESRVPSGDADSVGRLADAFNAMAEHLQSSLTIQREMVRAVSHELRTPVARLRFGLEMIGDAETETARRKYMDGMDADIQDLDKLLDEMLTYARLEQGAPALDFQEVDLDALIDQVIIELAPLYPNIRVERGQMRAAPDGSTVVEGEFRYLHRALQNLLSNAMRHAESRVRLSYQIGVRRCRLDVEDDGPGVPESERERLFRPFLRLDNSRTRASGGHGLGLSIVRRIIYWHGGRAWIGDSESLGGARFSLIWPRQQTSGDAPVLES